MDGRIRCEDAVITYLVDADIFVSGKKKLRIKKYPDTCGRGLSECKHFEKCSVILIIAIYGNISILVFETRGNDAAVV